ncbi:hypothetical protein [Stenotrophobium rhamnosiphilum]|nr:hypothetical protein [Stenotrophobium rhamnosiphilum]
MNHTKAVPALRELNNRVGHYLDRALSGIALVAVHEAGTLRGHWTDVDVRFRVARRARDAGELIRDQIDLLPESRNRMARDQRVRRELWRGVVKDFSAQVAETET